MVPTQHEILSCSQPYHMVTSQPSPLPLYPCRNVDILILDHYFFLPYLCRIVMNVPTMPLFWPLEPARTFENVVALSTFVVADCSGSPWCPKLLSFPNSRGRWRKFKIPNCGIWMSHKAIDVKWRSRSADALLLLLPVEILSPYIVCLPISSAYEMTWPCEGQIIYCTVTGLL